MIFYLFLYYSYAKYLLFDYLVLTRSSFIFVMANYSFEHLFCSSICDLLSPL